MECGGLQEIRYGVYGAIALEEVLMFGEKNNNACLYIIHAYAAA